MATIVEEHTITTEWKDLGAARKKFVIQNISDNPATIIVTVGTLPPAALSMVGFRIGTFPYPASGQWLTELGATENIYIRAMEGTAKAVTLIETV